MAPPEAPRRSVVPSETLFFASVASRAIQIHPESERSNFPFLANIRQGFPGFPGVGRGFWAPMCIMAGSHCYCTKQNLPTVYHSLMGRSLWTAHGQGKPLVPTACQEWVVGPKKPILKRRLLIGRLTQALFSWPPTFAKGPHLRKVVDLTRS